MRSVSRINKVLVIVLAAAIATVVMALPVCASTPLPSSTPNSNIYPTHIDASLRVYCLKYNRTTTWYQHTDIDSTGNAVAFTGRGSTDFVPISPSIDQMIAVYSTQAQKFAVIRSIAFYDSNHSFISQFSQQYSSHNIPDNAAYFRLTVASGGSASALASVFRVLVSPDYVPCWWDSSTNSIVFSTVFWLDYLIVQAYMIYEDGKSSFLMTSSYPVDGLYAEITLSQSFHIANYISATVYTTVKDGSYNNSFYPVEYNDRDERDAIPQYLTMRPFYIDSSGEKIYPDSFDEGAVLSDNPATVFVYSPDGLISGFNLFIPLNTPTGLTANSTIQVDISNIAFDDMSVVIPEWSISTINQIENAVASAEVPVPSFDLGDIVVNAISNVDFNAANNLFGWFWGISIVASMTALVGMFCLIGYVFFGKKG